MDGAVAVIRLYIFRSVGGISHVLHLQISMRTINRGLL